MQKCVLSKTTAMEMDYETDDSEKTSEYAPLNMSYIDRAQYKSIRTEC